MKKFVIGFVKGLAYYIPWLVIFALVPDEHTLIAQRIAIAASILLVIYLRSKYRLPYAWVLVSFIAGAGIIPFIFGAIAVQEDVK